MGKTDKLFKKEKTMNKKRGKYRCRYCNAPTQKKNVCFACGEKLKLVRKIAGLRQCLTPIENDREE